MKELEPNDKIDVREVLKDLENYRPRRKSWTWRVIKEDHEVGPFVLKDTSENLKNSVPLPSAH